MLGGLGQNIDLPSPIFKAFDNNLINGVALLDANLTINSATETPIFRYTGKDATTSSWPAWGYGESLSIAGAGSDVSPNKGSPLLGFLDDSVLINAGKYFDGSDNTIGDVSTEDITFEALVKITSTVSFVFSKRTAVAPNEGIGCFMSGNQVAFFIDAGAVSAQINSATLIPGSWYHVMGFVNRDENSTSGMQMYINGFASGSGVNPSGASGTLTNTNVLKIGANQSNGQIFDSNIAYLSFWKRDSWHQAGAAGPTEWAAIAKERFSKLIGIYPTKFSGTAVPTSFTRSSIAQLEKLDAYGSQLFSDADMEAVGVSSWTSYQANLSKISGSRPGGSGSQVLRVEQSAGGSSSTAQKFLTNGSLYKFSGWARVPSGAVPRTAVIRSFPNNYKTFTITDDWQKFDFYFIANDPNNRGLEIGHSGTAPDTSEWDDLNCVEVIRKQYSVGSGWMRVESVLDGYNSFISGYRSEETETNLLLQSNNLETTWTSSTVGIDNNRISVEDGISLQGLIPNNTNSNHLIQQSVILTENYYTFSAIVAPGVRTSCKLQAASIANTFADFNLTVAGSVSSKGSNVNNARITPLGRSMYRVEITFGTPDVTTDFRIWVDTGNYLGDGVNPGIYAGFIQLEAGYQATSHIKTTSGTATRSADDLYYKSDDGNVDTNEGTFICNFLIPERNQPGDMIIAYINSNGIATPRIVPFISGSTRVARFFVTPAAGNSAAISGTTNTATNKINEYRSVWKLNDTRLYLNRTREGVDTLVDMAPSLNRLSVGSGNAGTFQLNGLISNLRIYNKITEK